MIFRDDESNKTRDGFDSMNKNLISQIRSNIDITDWRTIINYLENDDQIQYVMIIMEGDFADTASRLVESEQNNPKVDEIEQMLNDGKIKLVFSRFDAKISPTEKAKNWRLQYDCMKMSDRVECLYSPPGYIVKLVK